MEPRQQSHCAAEEHERAVLGFGRDAEPTPNSSRTVLRLGQNHLVPASWGNPSRWTVKWTKTVCVFQRVKDWMAQSSSKCSIEIADHCYLQASLLSFQTAQTVKFSFVSQESCSVRGFPCALPTASTAPHRPGHWEASLGWEGFLSPPLACPPLWATCGSHTEKNSPCSPEVLWADWAQHIVRERSMMIYLHREIGQTFFSYLAAKGVHETWSKKNLLKFNNSMQGTKLFTGNKLHVFSLMYIHGKGHGRPHAFQGLDGHGHMSLCILCHH